MWALPSLLALIFLMPVAVLFWRSYRATGLASWKWRALTIAVAAITLSATLALANTGAGSARVTLLGTIGSALVLLLWGYSFMIRLRHR